MLRRIKNHMHLDCKVNAGLTIWGAGTKLGTLSKCTKGEDQDIRY